MFAKTKFLTALSLLCLWLGQPVFAAAPAPKTGDAIYRQMCVKCHGKAGEGVKGKYDDVLYGDWSVEKLTRYIAKNMPEDKPGACTGADADAVSRYIHDTFYSREARAKQHPPRVELARLTNRQYLNTVADLIQQFQTGAPPKFPGPEQGLRGTYSAARTEKQGDAKVEQLDRQFVFDFGTNAPSWAPGTTNGFSMRWRGSLLADETGDYEFVIKTPNAARLWVNDDNEPLIDGAVASGDLNEQKAKIRLIGGRAYPVRLEFIRAPRDKRGSFSLQWKPPRGPQMAIPGRNLSPDRVPATYVITTPFPADDSSQGYERGVQISPAWDEAATQAAIEVAHHVVKKLDQFAHVKPEETNRVAKVEAFCREFVAAAFRRPLTEEQTRVFVTAQLKRGKLEDAVKRVVLLTLKSPRFLYLGLEGEQPDAYTVAQRLAFGLWDSLPDQALTRAATLGKLATPAQVQAQAQRLLNDPRAHAKMQAFLQHWLQMNHAEDLSKDAILFPGFTPEIVADLRTSLNLFLADVVWSEKSDYRDLLLADYLFLNDRLAAFYGVSTNGSNDFIKVARPAGERSGVLTHPYLLAEFSYPRSTSPIHRGVFLTRNVVGRALRPPPMAVAFKDAEFAPHMTMREKITELTRSESCQTCHSVINPLGFTLEHYDAVGRFRTAENGRPVDALSDYVTDDGKVVKLTGARDVADFAVASDHSKNRFIEQLFHDVAKQPVLAYDSGLMDRLRLSFVANGCNMQKLLVEIATVTARQGAGKTTPASKKP